MIPRALRIWFVVHFAVDIAFAVPLMIAPEELLTAFGWSRVDPLASRLVAAALLGIGVESLRGRGGGPELFRGMLDLKIVWSTAAIVGIALSLPQVRVPMAWAVLGVFVVFNAVWVSWRIRLRDA